MFAFLQKSTPVIEVANALWIRGVSDGPVTRAIAEAASEENSPIVFDEAVYFMSFATDLTIHKVFKDDAKREHALRQQFLDHVRGYARYQRCTPCPIGDWAFDDSNIWEIQSPGRDTGDPALHFVDRLLLYAAAMRRPWESGKWLPAVGVLGTLCNTLDASFNLTATEIFIEYSALTQDFLRSIRVKP